MTYERRTFNYLRVSITDRCNLRCLYCMPENGVPKKDHSMILSYEEIVDIIKAAIKEGVRRIRITGGEPLVRKGLVDFVRMLAVFHEIEDLSLTTNGHLLSEFAGQLKAAGLKRINISLDSLDPERYKLITRCGNLEKVLSGIKAAKEVGFSPIKINVVLIPGINDSEILDFAELAFREPFHVRFIENMPFSDENRSRGFISEKEVMKKIAERYTLREHSENSGGGPASLFSITNGVGKIGFISSRTKPFCQSCCRLRLTADGKLMPCLDSLEGVNVRGKSIGEIRAIIRKLAEIKFTRKKQCADFDKVRCISLSDIGG